MTSSVKFTAENKVTISYDLTLPAPNGTHIEGKKSCTSGSSLGAPAYYKRTAESDGSFRHANDPDSQLFDWLANEVWSHYKPSTVNYRNAAANTVGSITVADDQGPCRSCRNVFKAFAAEFPLVAITVIYPKRGEFPQTSGMGCTYGYIDAVETKGMWQKVL